MQANKYGQESTTGSNRLATFSSTKDDRSKLHLTQKWKVESKESQNSKANTVDKGYKYSQNYAALC